MTTWRIYNAIDGTDLGEYETNSRAEALRMFLADTDDVTLAPGVMAEQVQGNRTGAVSKQKKYERRLLAFARGQLRPITKGSPSVISEDVFQKRIPQGWTNEDSYAVFIDAMASFGYASNVGSSGDFAFDPVAARIQTKRHYDTRPAYHDLRDAIMTAIDSAAKEPHNRTGATSASQAGEVRHPRNRTRYKSLDRLAADPRVIEVWDEGPDGLWVTLAPGWNWDGASSLHEWRVKDLLARLREVAAGDSW